MRCETTSDVNEFWTRARAFLETDPVRNSVILTNAFRRLAASGTDALPATYAVVYGEHDAVVGAAMRTPPFHAYVSPMPPEAIEPLVDALLAACPDNDGVTGTSQEAVAYAKAWAQRTGLEARPIMRQRIHTLETVVPARPVSGEIRLATEADRELLIAWENAFHVEADHGRTPAQQNAAGRVDARLAEDLAYVWDDGGPVSYVGITPILHGVVRIGPVYTPPKLRGRGYASAAVAAVSQGALDAGAKVCSLFTDLANPTSNKIYAAVGYRPVTEVEVYKFTDPA